MLPFFRNSKRLTVCVLLTLSIQFEWGNLSAQSYYFPPLTGTSWDTVSVSALGWCQPELDSLIDYVGQRNSKAFILLKNGKIVSEHYYGTFTRDSLWYWASAGKSLTACLAGIAQQEGLLSIQNPTTQYIGSGWTSCTPTQEQAITVRNQLTMTSGLDDGVTDPYCTDDTCLQFLAAAGTRWAYHNAPYTLLDSVLESATGVSLNTYNASRLKSRTGMDGFYFQSGYNNLYLSTPRSMARFGSLILNRGEWDGTPVLSDTSYFRQMTTTSQSFNQSYGYLWWLNGKSSFMAPGLQWIFPGSWSPNAPADMIAALGKNGQMINVVPSQNLVWIRMGEDPTGNDVPFSFNDTIWQYINRVQCTATSVEVMKPEVTLSIYPNPAIDQVTIDMQDQIRGVAELVDVTGRLISTQEVDNTSFSIDLKGVPKGLYVILLRAVNGNNLSGKLLVE